MAGGRDGCGCHVGKGGKGRPESLKYIVSPYGMPLTHPLAFNVYTSLHIPLHNSLLSSSFVNTHSRSSEQLLKMGQTISDERRRATEKCLQRSKTSPLQDGHVTCEVFSSWNAANKMKHDVIALKDNQTKVWVDKYSSGYGGVDYAVEVIATPTDMSISPAPRSGAPSP